MKISVSFTKFKENQKKTIEAINQTDADYLHIDLMDGKFVNNKQQLPNEINKLLPYIKKPLDVHLMAENPLKYLDFFANINTDYFVVHLEINQDINHIYNEVSKRGLRFGLAINPETDIKEIEPIISLLDQVLIMSVNPGAGGSSFMPEVLSKIKKLKELKEEYNYQYLINVDGGVNDETINLVKESGADMVVSGSYICLSDDMQGSIDSLR